MSGCELCDVGPEDECSMDCPSRDVLQRAERWQGTVSAVEAIPLVRALSAEIETLRAELDAARLSQPADKIPNSTDMEDQT